MDIDLVYLWVNGSDPVWMAKRDAFIGKPTERQENCKGRYADSGDLKYSLRSVEMYAPWIRKIFIVTDNQVPEWLDTSNPRVQIVDHKDIMPTEALPCYNSAVIEQFIYRIPGLAEHFLYATDDVYFNQPVTPATFFGADGYPVIFMNRKPLRKLGLFLKEKLLGKPISPYLRTIHNAALLVEKEYGHYYGDKLHHNIDAYTKSNFELVFKKFGKELLPMRTHHVRSADDIQRVIFSLVPLAEKRGHLRYVDQHHSFRLHIDNHRHYAKIEKYNPVLFCMNDSEYANDEDRIAAIRWVSSRFPAPSSFEK